MSQRPKILALMLLCLLVAASLRLPYLSQYPPGLHYDEAANAILAAEIGWERKRPIFIESYTGKEVLFFYVAGGLMRLVGESVFSLRLTAAYLGLLTVAATYWLGRELFPKPNIAILAAGLMAISFWHVLFSRLGFRAVSQPLLQALTLAMLWRGLRRNDWRWLAGSGFMLGLTAYTYLAARLFPVLLSLMALPLLFRRHQKQQRWLQLALVMGVAFFVLAPFLYYFMTHPDAFWVRIRQVAPNEQATLPLWQSFLRSFGMFFGMGDPYWRFNVPERPLFAWYMAPFFLAGWGWLLWRWQHVESDLARAARLLLWFAPLIMLLPTALATSEIVPSNLRAIGLMPFIFYLPAIGLWVAMQHIPLQNPHFHWQRSIMLLLILGGSLSTYRTYFRQWAVLPELFYESDGDLAAIATYLDELNLEETYLYVAALHYQHPTLAFLSTRYDNIKWLPDSQALVLPPEGNTAVYIYPHNSPLPDWARAYLKTIISVGEGPDGQVAFTAYRLTQRPPLNIPKPTEANFSNILTLLGYDIGSGTAGEHVPLTLFWQVENVPSGDFTPFVHMEDAWRTRWSQIETFAYPTTQWQPGEVIIQRIDVPVTAGTPPGLYDLRLGLFNPNDQQRLAQFDNNGRYAGDSFFIENVYVAAGTLPENSVNPPYTLTATPRPGLQLLGFERGGQQVATGETFHLAFWWQATQTQPDLITRLELMRSDNTGVILSNTHPVHDTFPFRDWPTPIFLIDHASPRIPDNFQPGEYELSLRLLDNDNNTLLLQPLGPLSIVPTERLFTPPSTQYKHPARFSQEIELLGYNLNEINPLAFELTLVWQALTTPNADYTVFIHLLDTNGLCCVWQQDVMPRQNQYPTTRWQTGEVVIDTYQIALPSEIAPGRYPIEVGLYVADSGLRLQATVPNQPPRDAVYLFPITIPFD